MPCSWCGRGAAALCIGPSRCSSSMQCLMTSCSCVQDATGKQWNAAVLQWDLSGGAGHNSSSSRVHVSGNKSYSGCSRCSSSTVCCTVEDGTGLLDYGVGLYGAAARWLIVACWCCIYIMMYCFEPKAWMLAALFSAESGMAATCAY